MSHEYERQSYKGFTIRIMSDDEALNPRELGDNFGKIVCWHRRYLLGDEQPEVSPRQYLSKIWAENASDEEIREMINYCFKNLSLGEKKNLLSAYRSDYQALVEGEEMEHPTKHVPDSIEMLNLYLYDHSGITMRTSSFGCPWDSGQVGFTYCTAKEIVETYGEDSKETRDKARKLLDAEITTYDFFLRGDMWGYIVEDEDGEQIDSVWGFYGSDDCLEEAKGSVDFIAKKRDEEIELLARKREEELAIVRENEFDNHFGLFLARE